MKQAEALADKRLIAASFSRAAESYDGVAALQREVGLDLLQDVLRKQVSPNTVLDLGCGTGHFCNHLARNFRNAHLLGLDLSLGMLRKTRENSGLSRLICADANALPLRDESVDLIFSNLALQWCDDLPAVFKGLKRVLKPQGYFFFSSFGPETLSELRAAWKKVDDYAHVNAFQSVDFHIESLIQAGFSEFIVSSGVKTLCYPSVDALMHELKRLGAHNVNLNRPKSLMGKAAMQKMREAYADAMVDGNIRAGFEMVVGYARRD